MSATAMGMEGQGCETAEHPLTGYARSERTASTPVPNGNQRISAALARQAAIILNQLCTDSIDPIVGVLCNLEGKP